MDNEQQSILNRADYVDPSWVGDNSAYYIIKSGLGSFWPQYIVKARHGGWCPIVIKDSNPFKTLKGAIRFIDAHRNRY